MDEKTVRIQDDLYEAVNGEWLKTAVIPDDRPTTGGFSILDQEVEKLMMDEFRAFAAGEKTTDIPEMKYAVELYKKALDTLRRNSEGIAPALPLLERIRGLKTPAELNEHAAELLLKGADLPLLMDVTADMQDAEKNSFIVAGPETILPDTTYYADDNEAGRQLLAVYADMAQKALAFAPLTDDERKQYLDDALAFDALVAKKVKSMVEWSEYYKCHNPMDADEVASYTAPFDIKGTLEKLYGENAPKTLIVYDPRAVKEMNGYFSEENFSLYVHWAYVRALLKATPYLSEELAAIGRTYSRILRGVNADPSLEKQAYQLVSEMYSEPIGVYYGRTYFGEEAKKDVVELVKKIIETYKFRMAKNGFLAEETKEQAIKKLSTIEIKMGYPDEIKPMWSKLVFDADDSLFAAMTKLFEIRAKDSL
ncbi:MAG: M13 family peptidase, partial [Clostridia bacterium]|nr:M13 family peptidase [Clostridia bacterium]